MESWRQQLKVDPIPPLLAAEDKALTYFVGRDLLGEQVAPVESLWTLPEPTKLLTKQQPDGSWKYPGKRNHGHPGENYALLETFRSLRILVDQYGYHRGHPGIALSADYVFDHQTEEGDIRGIFGPEYVPHYSAWTMELLVKAGYVEEEQIRRAFGWFGSMRQEDGGWAWPIRTANVRYEDAIADPSPTQPDRSRPFSHVLTGGVLRLYAAHPKYRRSGEALAAAELLKSRFFLPDRYPDRKGIQYWTRFGYPFWWPDLLTSLDSLSMMGYTAGDEAIERGVAWFLEHQQVDGLWPTGYKDTGTAKSRSAKLWVSLAICRVLGRYLV